MQSHQNVCRSFFPILFHDCTILLSLRIPLSGTLSTRVVVISLYLDSPFFLLLLHFVSTPRNATPDLKKINLSSRPKVRSQFRPVVDLFAKACKFVVATYGMERLRRELSVSSRHPTDCEKVLRGGPPYGHFCLLAVKIYRGQRARLRDQK